MAALRISLLGVMRVSNEVEPLRLLHDQICSQSKPDSSYSHRQGFGLRVQRFESSPSVSDFALRATTGQVEPTRMVSNMPPAKKLPVKSKNAIPRTCQ